MAGWQDSARVCLLVGASRSRTGYRWNFGNLRWRPAAGFSLQGAALTSIAGTGYGAFSVAMKRMEVSGGLHFTRLLLLFGSLYLLMPAAAERFVIGELSPLLALATLPTILGLFCTTKAIEYLKPSHVQALELTEPLFARSRHVNQFNARGSQLSSTCLSSLNSSRPVADSSRPMPLALKPPQGAWGNARL